MPKVRVKEKIGSTLLMGDEGFELYIDELVEECVQFTQIVAKLRKLSEDSPKRDELETNFYGSLAHLEAHSRELNNWVDELIEQLPDDE